MTIREHILENTRQNVESRLQKLEEMQAPEVLISSVKSQLTELENGQIEIGGDAELLQEDYVSVELKKGSGGKVYFEYNGNINYFPKAKYGRFIARRTR